MLISPAIRASDGKLSFIFAPRRMKNRYGQKRCALLAALEFKSQVRPSFDNNVNKLSRGHGTEGEPSSALTGKGESEENAPHPFLGWIMLLKDCDNFNAPVRDEEPDFPVDPAFKGASFTQHYDWR